MHPSVAAAERGAIEVQVPELDTQKCFAVQDALLSGSPAHVASNLDDVHQAGDESDEPPPLVDAEQDKSEQYLNDAEDNQAPATDQRQQRLFTQSELNKAGEAPVEDGEPNKQESAAHIQYKRDRSGRLRAFTVDGNEFRRQDFEEKHRAAFEETQRIEMDDLTQKSSMSLTQANPESAYEQFNIQKEFRDDVPPSATPDDGGADNKVPNDVPANAHDSLHSKQYASARTESTVHTYQENDTGHVKFEFVPDPVEDEIDGEQSQSQDASFAAPHLGLHFSAPVYDPQTPAAPVNPFSQKGSVMKGFELFGATQPSSVARHASPTSSRPSPDIYNEFSSPPKRQRIGSSPLARLYEAKEADHSSPLQSSVRDLLASSTEFPYATIPRTSGVQSFDMGPRLSRRESMREPRPYVSMKESQERRRRDSMRSRSESEGSDTDVEAVPRNRKRERELRIQKELSTVALPPRRMPTSSRPSSANSPAIEVPSTGRRRNVQDEYVVQCESFDARDTQDEFIADSQAVPEFNVTVDQQELHGLPEKARIARPVEETEPALVASGVSSETRYNSEAGNSQYQPDQLTKVDSAVGDQVPRLEITELKKATGSSLPEASLPLQEFSGNRNELWTPMAAKNHLQLDGLETVPETSPPEERIRPMGEIASISFRESQIDIDIDDLPGFTQDLGFVRAMEIASPPRPAPRARSFRNKEPSDATPTSSAALPGEAPSSLEVPPTLAGHGLPNLQKEAPLVSPIAVTSTPQPENDAPQANPILEHNIPGNPSENLGEDKAARGEVQENVADNLGEKNDEASSIAEENPDTNDSATAQDSPGLSSTRRSGLRTKGELKGRSKSLRRSDDKASVKATAKSSASSTPASTPLSVPDAGPSERPKTRRQGDRGKSEKQSTPAPNKKKSVKRQLAATVIQDGDQPLLPTRASKRHSTANLSREDSEDPLALTPTSTNKPSRRKSSSDLFAKMAFAVSYVKNNHERDSVTKMIVDNGGRILQEGFDVLFNIIPKTASEDVALSLSESACILGFTALIADEHSRKAKYMQALALGLPCISGRWISACVAKMSVVDWTPYLLCAGQSSFLGDVARSRTIRPYPASDALLADVFSDREKLLEGRSILLVTGKGKTEDKRKAYVFLTRALGPARVGQVVDYQEARKRLVEAEAQDQQYDILYVEGNEKTADSFVFSSVPVASSGSKKRKRGPDTPADDGAPTPKKIRVIGDEIMIQSLILGQLLEEE